MVLMQSTGTAAVRTPHPSETPRPAHPDQHPERSTGPRASGPFFAAVSPRTPRPASDPVHLRGEAMDALRRPESPADEPAQHAGWIAAARAAGHPVVVVQAG